MCIRDRTIDLRVTGNAEEKAKKIERSVKSIKDLARGLKPVPNLFDNRTQDKDIRKAKEELKKLVGEYGKGTGAGKRFSNTLAGLNSQISAFGKIIGNVNVNSDEFVSAITAQEKASRRLAKAEAERLKVQTRVNTANTVGRATSVQETLDLGKVIPKSIAGLELYQRELQETFRNVEIGTESYRELRDEILRVNALMRDFEMNAPAPSSPIGGRADIPGSPAALAADRNARAQRRSQRRRDVLTGAGFPLLFGGGPVQALAGGVGGALGGLGGSIAGSAIASQVEAFARAAAETGVALTSTSGALELVRDKSLFSKEANRELAAQLEEQGDAAGLAKLLTEELSLAIGNNGVQALQDLGNTTKETTRLWNLLTTQLFKLIAGPLDKFLKIVNNVLGGITTRGRFEGLSEDLAGNEAFQAAVREKRKARGRNAQLGSLQTEDQIDLLQRAEAGEFGALPRTAVIPVTDEDKRTITAKGRQKKDRLPSLDAELGLKRRLLVLNKEIAQAILDGDKANQVLLEKEKVREELAGQIEKIEAKGLTAKVQAKEIDIARVDAAQKIQDIDTKTAQTKADQVKKGQEALDGLLAEQNLLQATLDGRKEEEEITQRMNELRKENPTLSEEELRGILETNAGLKEKIRLMKEAEAFAKQISTTIRDGLVDGIMAAVDGTRSLSESLSGILKQLGKMFLSKGIGNFSKDGKGGSGLLGLLPFADGGRPPVGRPSIVGERGPELFVPRSSGTIIPNHQLGGGSTNVVVNVDAKGTAAQGNDANADQLGRVIGAAVQAELIKQKRPGGLLTR